MENYYMVVDCSINPGKLKSVLVIYYNFKTEQEEVRLEDDIFLVVSRTENTVVLKCIESKNKYLIGTVQTVEFIK